jgi:heat shock transcription factor
MYGFHKIPHLQQGVLKSDTDTEFWNFAHANFHRGQPDLLCLIQRKKQTPQQGDESIELRDATNGVGLIGAPTAPAGATAGGTASLSNGQVLDIQSIVSGINAIKRHQTTISAELTELKRSNQLLWQDALATRTRHQKQQDTINRIVKFLAGVFGSHPAAGAGVAVPSGTQNVGAGQGNQDRVDGATIGSNRRMRLMIEDAKRDGPTKSMVEELAEIPQELDTAMQYGKLSLPSGVTSLLSKITETPTSLSSPTPAVDGSFFYFDSNAKNPNGDSTVSSQQPQQGKPESTETQEQQGNQISRAVSPNRSPTTIELDARFHNMLNQLSPSQIQLLLASLAPQTIIDPPTAPAETTNAGATGSLTQYQPHFDFSQANNHLPTVDGLISFDNYDPQLPGDTTHSIIPSDHEPMEKQWRAAEEIDKGVNALNTSINSLIQDFGLDPALFDATDQNQHDMDGTAGGVNASHAPMAASDFDFDSLFNNLSSGPISPSPTLGSSNPGTATVGMDYGDMGVSSHMSNLTSAAFLDEVHTPTASSDMTASPVQSLRQVSPELTMTGTSDAEPSPANLSVLNGNGGGMAASNANTTGKGTGSKKRKSEMVVDVDPTAALSDTTKGVSGTKPKRRKDK